MPPESPSTHAAAILALRQLLKDRLSTDPSVRTRHGKDESYHAVAPPDAVAFPGSTEEVSAVVKTCAQHKVPIIPFGAGSSLEGQISAVHGGVSIDLSRMNRVLEINTGDLDATVEA